MRFFKFKRIKFKLYRHQLVADLQHLLLALSIGLIKVDRASNNCGSAHHDVADDFTIGEQYIRAIRTQNLTQLVFRNVLQ